MYINQSTSRRLKTIAILLFMVFVLCIDVQSASAAVNQSHDSIYKAARNHIYTNVTAVNKKQVSVKVGKLDSRLKLKRCEKALISYSPKGSRMMGKTTVGVKCSGRKPWSLQVPVTISVYSNVLVASKQLQKGTVLKQTDIKLERRDLAELSYGYIEDIASGAGLKLKKRVLAGVVITPNMLKRPKLISRGQQVSIIAQTGLMQVRMEGKALANGAAGERIKVLNLNSRKKVEGLVTLSGEVRIDL